MKKEYSLAVIGLGAMGMGAAKSCVKAGLTTYGVDLNEQLLAELKTFGASDVSTSAEEFTDKLDALVLYVVNAQQVKSILFGNEQQKGLVQSIHKKTVIMVCSTMSADDMQFIANGVAEYNLKLLDAPVSGGMVRADKGEITIMASGTKEVFDLLKPVLDAISSKIYNMGTEIGLGSTMKLVHQLLAGIHITACAEALALASKKNIPLDIMYDVVTSSAGNSWMFENRAGTLISGYDKVRSAIDIILKDMRIVVGMGTSEDFPMPLASTALSMLAFAHSKDCGGEDDSELARILFNDETLPENGKGFFTHEKKKE